MKRVLKIAVLVLLMAFIAIQFFPTEKNQSVVITKDDFLLVNRPPKEINSILKASCYDCHSNNTDYLWYSKIQPAAWFLEDHIKEGKEELNFSEWESLSKRRKNSRLKSIINQIKDDEMPIFSYTLIHRDAVLSKSEKVLVIDYMQQMKDSLK